MGGQRRPFEHSPLLSCAGALWQHCLPLPRASNCAPTVRWKRSRKKSVAR